LALFLFYAISFLFTFNAVKHRNCVRLCVPARPHCLPAPGTPWPPRRDACRESAQLCASHAFLSLSSGIVCLVCWRNSVAHDIMRVGTHTQHITHLVISSMLSCPVRVYLHLASHAVCASFRLQFAVQTTLDLHVK
jgi:hypothetical protein